MTIIFFSDMDALSSIFIYSCPSFKKQTYYTINFIICQI